MTEHVKNFVRRHRPTLSLRRARRADPSTRLVVRAIAFRRLAFDLVESDDVDFHRYAPGQDFRSANVAVIPLHTASLDWVLERVPWIVWRLAAAGRLALVFDRSAEGTAHREEFTVRLHALLLGKGIELPRCLILTQNRTYRADYEAYCKASGVGRFMEVFEYDYFISRFFHDYAEHGHDVFERRLSEFRSRPAERERHFISLNRVVRPHRLRFLLSLMRDGLFESGFISFGGFKRSADSGDIRIRPEEAQEMLVREPVFGDLASALLPHLQRLVDLGDVFFGEGSFLTAERPVADLETDLYQKTWFTAVMETDMWRRPFRITEKPLKPLVNFHPFVIFGNPGSLALLRAFGFQTFGSVLDESYDGERDPRKRFDRVYNEVRKLCGLDQAELRRLEGRMQDILVANARYGLVEMPKVYRDRLNRALIEKVRAVASSQD